MKHQEKSAPANKHPRLWHLVLVLSFLALGVALSGFLYSRAEEQAIKQYRCSELVAIADLKIGQISQWTKERLADAELVRANVFLAREVQAFFENPLDDGAGAEVRAYMSTLKGQCGYRSVILLDSKIAVRMAVGSEETQIESAMASLAKEAYESGKVVFSDFYRNGTVGDSGDIRLDFVAPVRDSGSPSVVGLLVLSVDPREFLFPLIQIWPTPSPTSETLLVRREGDQVLYLNELKYRRGAALSVRIPMSLATLPGGMGLKGTEGIVEGIDYRSVPVFAVLRKVPRYPWVMVSKVDEEEVYAAARERLRLVAVTCGILILFAAAAAYVFWLRQQADFGRRQLKSDMGRELMARQYDSLSRYANDVILLADEEGRILDANERAVNVYGYARDDLLSMNLRDMSTSETLSALDDQMKQVEERGGMVFETVHRKKDGTTLQVEVSARVLETGSRKVSQSIVRDITERKQAEMKILRLNAELEQRVIERTAELEATNEELGAFAYSVSHDLRSPLRGIDGYAKVLMDGYQDKLDEDGRFVLGQVRASAQEMGTLINDLLAFSRMGRREMRKTTIDMTALFRMGFGELQESEPERRLKLKLDSLPAAYGDPSMLHVVVRNLLENALKFTRHREVGMIEVDAWNGEGGMGNVKLEENEKVYFVKDNGVGFDMKYSGKLFQVFQRLHGAEEFEGTGVGLAIVKRIINRHGGRVWAEAKVGEGATFYFILPNREEKLHGRESYY